MASETHESMCKLVHEVYLLTDIIGKTEPKWVKAEECGGLPRTNKRMISSKRPLLSVGSYRVKAEECGGLPRTNKRMISSK